MTNLAAMLPLATNWATISSLATGAGTLVLAVATFASVRSANRSARVAEEALLEQRRPILAQSRFDDPVQKIMFVERRWVQAQGGRGVVEYVNGNVYLAMSLRNVGTGIGVCQAWAVAAGDISSGRRPDHLPDPDFRAHTRDLYVPAGDLGMWQGAMRDPNDPSRADVIRAIETGEPVLVELLYSDQVGEQRTITRFALAPYTNQQSGEVHWTVSTVRHWFLDRPGPRSEAEIRTRAEQILARIESGAPAERSAVTAEAEAEPDQADEADGQLTRAPDHVTVVARPNCE